MKLVWKLAIPQICVVVCFALMSYIVIHLSFDSLREHDVRDVIEGRFQYIAKVVETSSHRSASESSIFVSQPAVIQAYEIALNGDIDDPFSPESQAARVFLRRELAPILNSYNNLMGKQLELHFHLPNGRSLVRMWREYNTRVGGEDGEWVDKSDDISTFRSTVMHTNQTGEVSMGIEPGSGGFAVRRVIPIIAPDGRRLGSVESLQHFGPILETAAEDGKVFIALYANRDLLDFSVELQDSGKYPPIGDFVRCIDAKNDDVDSLVTAELLSEGKTGVFFKNYPSMTLAVSPLVNYKGDQVGVVVCAMDTSTISSLANTASLVLALMLAGMVVVPTFSLLMQMRMLVSHPLNMVKAKIQDIAEDRADLSEQIPSRQKDEIGELARWFNKLTAKLDSIMKEHQAMAHWYKSILDATPYPITVTDANMCWTFVNKAVEDFLGTKLEDMVGKPCSDWNAHICKTDACGIACAKRGLKRTYFKQKERSHQVDVEILRDINGEIAGFIEVVQDITELEEMHNKQADAEAASKAKSNFLANMSHEIRTPLNAIVGMSAIGMSVADPERVKYCFSKIDDASKHLIGVINDILDISKIPW